MEHVADNFPIEGLCRLIPSFSAMLWSQTPETKSSDIMTFIFLAFLG